MKSTFTLLLSLLLALACAPAKDMSPQPEPTPENVAATPEPLAQTIDEAKMLLRSGRLEAFERGARVLSASPDLETRRQALALLGLHYVDGDRFEEAIPVLTEASGLDADVAPFLNLRLIDAYSRLGNAADAARVASEIIAVVPRSSAATVARIRLPGLYAAAGDAAATDAAWREIATLPIDEMNESDLAGLAETLAEKNRVDLANSIRMRLLTEYTGGRHIEKTYAALTGEATSPIHTLTEKDAVDLASRLARANRYDQALDLLDRTKRRSAGAAMSDAYRATRIRALFNSRHYGELLDETSKIKIDDPALLLLRARAAWRHDRPEEFLAILSAIERRFPASREAADAKVLRAKYYVTDETDLGTSIENLQAAIDRGAAGNDGENVWTLGFTQFLAERDDQALATFARYNAAYPDGDYKMNSLFWSAKIHERRKQMAERDATLRQLIAEYPYNYYSYRAKEILGLDPLAQLPASPAKFPDIEADVASVTDPRLATVRALAKIDLHRDAAREMKLIAADYAENLGLAFMLATLYVEGGEPFRANGLLQRRFRQFVRHGGSGITPRFWRILYPLNYFETIRKEAERRQLDPYLVASIIRQESGFEPTVVSSAGAVGLMQIMPGEAAMIASSAGIGGMTREQLFDPETNIAMGAAEYAQKLQRMGGDHILAIAAYNAGEEAVGRWLAQTPRQDVDVFVESIPYAETRLYVKSVNRNRYEYRRIYDSSPGSE
jgi:soluble lytic murein transglycosylase